MKCDNCTYKDKCSFYAQGSKDCVYEILMKIPELKEDAEKHFDKMKKG